MVSPALKGVFATFGEGAMESVFGAAEWQRYLSKPQERAQGGGVVTAKRSNDRRVPRWLPRGAIEISPALDQYVSGSSVRVSLTWDHSVDSQAGLVLLPGHCDYEWRVRRNGKTVDSEGVAWIFDNRTTELTLDGKPGVFVVSVVASSRHFLTPDHAFRASVLLKVVDEKISRSGSFRPCRDRQGRTVRTRPKRALQLKGGQSPLTVSQELQSLAITEGAIDALLANGHLTPGNHQILAAELAKQRAALEQVKTETASG